jgi:hypothetical protein
MILGRFLGVWSKLLSNKTPESVSFHPYVYI